MKVQNSLGSSRLRVSSLNVHNLKSWFTLGLWWLLSHWYFSFLWLLAEDYSRRKELLEYHTEGWWYLTCCTETDMNNYVFRLPTTLPPDPLYIIVMQRWLLWIMKGVRRSRSSQAVKFLLALQNPVGLDVYLQPVYCTFLKLCLGLSLPLFKLRIGRDCNI